MKYTEVTAIVILTLKDTSAFTHNKSILRDLLRWAQSADFLHDARHPASSKPNLPTSIPDSTSEILDHFGYHTHYVLRSSRFGEYQLSRAFQPSRPQAGRQAADRDNRRPGAKGIPLAGTV